MQTKMATDDDRRRHADDSSNWLSASHVTGFAAHPDVRYTRHLSASDFLFREPNYRDAPV